MSTALDFTVFMNVLICCYNRCYGNAVKGLWVLTSSVCMLVGDRSLSRDFGPNGIMFTVLDFPVIRDGQFTSNSYHIIQIHMWFDISDCNIAGKRG
jgi:hypothetical protein